MNKKAGSIVLIRSTEFDFISNNGGSLHLLNTLKLYKRIYENVYLIDVSAYLNIRDPFSLKANVGGMDGVVHITVRAPLYQKLYLFIKCLFLSRLSGIDFGPFFFSEIFHNKAIHDAIHAELTNIAAVKWVIIDYLGISGYSLKRDRQNFKFGYLSYNFEREYWIRNGAGSAALHAVEVMEKESCDSADAIFCISEADCIDISRAYDVPLRKFNSVPFVYDDQSISMPCSSGILSNVGISGDFVLFIGSRHAQNKDAVCLIERLAVFMPDIDFIIAGSAGIFSTSKESNIHTFGWLNDGDKNFLLSKASLALNPSFGGSGMATKLIEYFAWSVPVVTTRFGMRGLIGDESYLSEIALVAETDDDFSAAIRSILDNKEIRDGLSLRSRKYFENNFSISSGVSRLSPFL